MCLLACCSTQKVSPTLFDMATEHIFVAVSIHRIGFTAVKFSQLQIQLRITNYELRITIRMIRAVIRNS